MPERPLLTPLESLWDRIVDFLPNFVAAVVLFVVGVSIAWGIRFLVIKVLNSINWEKAAGKSPLFRLLGVGDIRYPFFDLIGAVVFWVVILAFSATAAHALGLTSLELLLQRVVSFIPNLLFALLIIGLGVWFGLLAGRFARAFAFSAQIHEADLIGKGIQYLVIIIAAGTALEQLKVATSFLFGAFLIILGSLGLAFGLGGKEKAREIIDRISGARKQ